MRRLVLIAACLVPLTGCVRGCTSSRPPIHLNPSMDDQPKLQPQSESRFFYDGAGMRPPVAGTVARGELEEDVAFFRGVGPDGEPLATNPVPVDAAVLARGSDRYAIYCAPCHDAKGDGQGILFQRGSVPTASFHTDKVRQYPDGRLFDVISNGSGLMPAYRWPVRPADRWAIVAHVRELQRARVALAAEGGAP